MTSSTGVPGSTASVGAVVDPSSSPVRFASRIGKATWSGRSERRGSKARTAAGQPVADAGVEQRRAARSRDDRARPVGRGQPRGLGDVGRRQVDVAQDRLVRVERADARVRERAGDLPEVARPRRGDGQDRRARQRRREEALEDDEVPRPAVRALRAPARTRSALTPNSSTLGRYESAVSRYGSPVADDEDQARPVGRDDGPGAVVDGQLVGRGRRRPDRCPTRRTSSAAHVASDVVDDHVGPGLGLELDVADLEQAGRRPTARGGAPRARGRGSRRSRRPSA